jgi:hypothetical protein
MMYRKIIYGFILLLWVSPLISQGVTDPSSEQARDDAEKKYGPITELVNGVKYYYPYWADTGDPFFRVEEGKGVPIQINGRLFDKQDIRYDIYNQLIVLDYTDVSGAAASIVLRNEWVDYFYVGGRLFMEFPDEDGNERFGQIIHEEDVSCIYFWQKNYDPDMQNGRKNYKFSDPFRNAAIIKEGGTRKYKGKGSFLKCFSKNQQAEIKGYLKGQRIKFKKAGDPEMKRLLEFINQLS